MAADDGRLLIRPVTAPEIRSLRQRVLRPAQGLEATLYPGDDLADTVHLGAFDDDGRLVGIASLYREPRTGGRADGWRLRGMATEPDVRGQGYGAALLAACVESLTGTAGAAELWCNARLAAVGFYRRGGFEVVSAEFDVPDIGPHLVMAKALTP